MITAWNLAGGMDWTAIEVVAAILDIEDVEALARGMAQIRDWQRSQQEQ